MTLVGYLEPIVTAVTEIIINYHQEGYLSAMKQNRIEIVAAALIVA